MNTTMAWKEATTSWREDCRWDSFFLQEAENAHLFFKIQAAGQNIIILCVVDDICATGHSLFCEDAPHLFEKHRHNNVITCAGVHKFAQHIMCTHSYMSQWTQWEYIVVCWHRWNRTNMKSCRTWGSTSTPASPTSAASCCHILASRWPPTRTLMAGWEVKTQGTHTCTDDEEELKHARMTC